MQEWDNLNQWLDDPNILQSRKIFPVIKYSKLWFEWGVLSKQYKYTDNAAATNIAGFIFTERFDQNGTVQGMCPCPAECEYDEYQARLSTGYFPAKNYETVLNKLGITDVR